MKIVTWNILHPDHVYTENKYLEWDYRKNLIFEKLNTYDPDIICLQEVDATLISEIEIEFKNYSLAYQNDKTRTKKLKKWLDGIDTKKPNTLVCATLVKKSFGTITNVVVGSRNLTVIVNDKLKITNVHLESGKNTTDIHIKHLEKLIDSDIICGDFNDFPDEPAIKFIEEKGFNNAYSLRKPLWTVKDENESFIVDYLFYKGKIEHVDWVTFQGISKDHPSDHSPIFAIFQ